MVNILIAPFLSAKIKKIVESAIKAKNGKLCVQTGKSINSCLLFFSSTALHMKNSSCIADKVKRSNYNEGIVKYSFKKIFLVWVTGVKNAKLSNDFY